MAGVSASGFQFPDYHSNYPPFFTRQKQTEALSTQIEWWCKLILDYCRAHRIFWLDLAKTGDSKLFRNHHSNPVFDRRLSDTDIRFFLQKLVDRNEGEWNEDKTMCLVYWRRPAEWGELIFQWAGRNGFGNGIVTAKTIIDGPYSQGEEFVNLEQITLVRALESLERQGRCAFMSRGVGEGFSIKFGRT